MQPKTEQLACFAQTFAPLSLANSMTAPWVEIYRLRGGNIIMRSLCNVTRGAKSDALVFFRFLQKKAYQNKVTGLIFFTFPCLVDAPGT